MAVWQILLDSLERRPNNCIPRSSAAFGHFGSLPASASRVSIWSDLCTGTVRKSIAPKASTMADTFEHRRLGRCVAALMP
jgi:hypothetical protein